MPLVKVKEKFQVTIPTELREALHLAVGDPFEATIERDTIVPKPKAVVDRAQAWAQMERAMASAEDMAPNLEQSLQEEEEAIARMVKEYRGQHAKRRA